MKSSCGHRLSWFFKPLLRELCCKNGSKWISIKNNSINGLCKPSALGTKELCELHRPQCINIRILGLSAVSHVNHNDIESTIINNVFAIMKAWTLHGWMLWILSSKLSVSTEIEKLSICHMAKQPWRHAFCEHILKAKQNAELYLGNMILWKLSFLPRLASSHFITSILLFLLMKSSSEKKIILITLSITETFCPLRDIVAILAFLLDDFALLQPWNCLICRNVITKHVKTCTAGYQNTGSGACKNCSMRALLPLYSLPFCSF